MRVRSDPKNEVAASHTNEITEKGGGFQRCRFVGRSNSSALAYGGLVYANASFGSAYSNANIGSRLAFKSRDLAIYCGKQFIDIWINYLFK